VTPVTSGVSLGIDRLLASKASAFRVGAKGLSHGGKITLLSGMQPAEEFSTLVHEIAHEMLHRGDRHTLTTKQARETEAEAVAFVVCQSVGLQNGTASQDYIQLWHGDANLLRESLEAVQQTAAVILGGIAHANNGNLHAGGSLGETGSPGIGGASETALRAIQGYRQADRIDKGGYAYAGGKKPQNNLLAGPVRGSLCVTIHPAVYIHSPAPSSITWTRSPIPIATVQTIARNAANDL
jgi:hypothetical protein